MTTSWLNSRGELAAVSSVSVGFKFTLQSWVKPLVAVHQEHSTEVFL